MIIATQHCHAFRSRLVHSTRAIALRRCVNMSRASVRTGLIIEGGDLRHAWAPQTHEVQVVEGRTYFFASRADRSFASFLGLNTSQRCPWRENSFMDYLCQLRNTAIDNILMSAWADVTDPSADRAVMPKRPRRDLAERLPATIEIYIPPDGGVPAHSMRMLTGYRKNMMLAFEITDENLDYLRLAVHVPRGLVETAPQWVHHSSKFHLAVYPNVSFMEDAQRIYARAKTPDGSSIQYSEKLPHIEDKQLRDQVANEVATRVQRWYNDRMAELEPVGDAIAPYEQAQSSSG